MLNFIIITLIIERSMAACSILIVIQEEGGGGRVERQKWETGNRRRYEGSVVFSILVSTVYVCVCVWRTRKKPLSVYLASCSAFCGWLGGSFGVWFGEHICLLQRLEHGSVLTSPCRFKVLLASKMHLAASCCVIAYCMKYQYYLHIPVACVQ